MVPPGPAASTPSASSIGMVSSVAPVNHPPDVGAPGSLTRIVRAA
jgi:hypothetical protein